MVANSRALRDKRQEIRRFCFSVRIVTFATGNRGGATNVPGCMLDERETSRKNPVRYGFLAVLTESH